MTALRWRWTVSGRRIEAVLDAVARTETVLVDGDVQSRAERGTKPEGHAVGDAIVAFDAYLPRCTLRRGGAEVAPDRAPPVSRRGTAPRTLVVWPVVAIAAIGLALGLLRLRGAHLGGGGLVVHRAETGTFVVRAPARLRSVKTPAAPGTEVLLLQDERNGDAVVVLAEEASGVDAWTLHKRRAPEVLAALPRGDASFVESARRDDRCAGLPGAVVTGAARTLAGASGRVVTCAFRHEDVGYVVATLVADDADATRAAEVQRVVDTFDATRAGPSTPN